MENAPTSDTAGVDGPHIPVPTLDLTGASFVVIGAGRVGSSLALAFRTQGAHLNGFVARTPEGRSRARSWLGIPAAPGVPELIASSPDIYVVAVPDNALPEVADELGARLQSHEVADRGVPLVLHTSGATSVAVLASCALAGALTMVFHPLQTFSDPPSGSTRFAGAAVAITPGSGGQHSAAGLLGFALARSLGARPFFLADERRTLYHAAATIACNYLVTLEYEAQRLFVRAGLAEEEALALFLPLVSATLENLRDQGPLVSLTGPLSRGDADTVARHVAALCTEEPALVPLYKVLGLATLDLVRARGDLEPQVVEELADLLGRVGGARSGCHLGEQGG